MIAALIQALSVLLVVTGFLALAVSMKRHQRDLAGRPLPASEARLARTISWIFLAIAFSVEAATLGPATGTIVWVGETSIGGWLTVALINWRSGRSAR